ncbi:MAG TPA: rhomboid family intramembrane serine protease [Nocardioidaceae bacterium]|nr:rhomboid family intramembrane serine protease [Nocardioidaceae bacterium]
MSSSIDPQPDAGTVPHCYRHRDRETYISCQRCARPICPDCMTQASVGFHCPECVKEWAAQAPKARTAYGGRLNDGSSVVTISLIVINVVFFIIARATVGVQGPGDFVWTMAMIPDANFPRLGIEGVAQGSYWQLITSTFLHTQLLHIAFNMFGLWIFGSFLEGQLGRVRYLALYLLTGLAGSVAIYLLTAPFSLGQPLNYSLGASGSIFGLFGAALIILLKQGRDVTQLLILLALNLAITFTVPDVSWQAHLGGLAAGLLLGAGFAYAPRERRTAVHVGLLAGLFVLCLALVVLRTAQLTA